MKKSLREFAKKKRRELDIQEISRILTNKLRSTQEYAQANNIMLYYPTSEEVNLLGILQDDKNFFLPRVEGDIIVPCPYKQFDDLQISKFNIKEPKTSAVEKSVIDLVIVPALCCDKHNCRLGYGKGFYDRFLADYKGRTIVCIPKELQVSSVYPEAHDVPIDLVITN